MKKILCLALICLIFLVGCKEEIEEIPFWDFLENYIVIFNNANGKEEYKYFIYEEISYDSEDGNITTNIYKYNSEKYYVNVIKRLEDKNGNFIGEYNQIAYIEDNNYYCFLNTKLKNREIKKYFTCDETYNPYDNIYLINEHIEAFENALDISVLTDRLDYYKKQFMNGEDIIAHQKELIPYYNDNDNLTLQINFTDDYEEGVVKETKKEMIFNNDSIIENNSFYENGEYILKKYDDETKVDILIPNSSEYELLDKMYITIVPYFNYI